MHKKEKEKKRVVDDKGKGKMKCGKDNGACSSNGNISKVVRKQQSTVFAIDINMDLDKLLSDD